MAEKTIPQLQEATTIDSSTIIPIDSGIQTYKISAPNLAVGLREFQEPGVPLWKENREYAQGDIINYEGVLYTSKGDENSGNLPTDTDFWVPRDLYHEINLS